MIKVKKEGVLLEKTTNVFEEEGVLNPGAIKDGDFVHMLYRAVSTGNYSSIGYCKLHGPKTVIERNETPLIVPEYDYESHGVEDPRIVKIDELYYLTYTAYDGVNALGALATSADLKHFTKLGIVVPQITYEEFSLLTVNRNVIGITKNGTYANGELEGIPYDSRHLLWDKNLIFFPRRIHGKLYFLHRIKPNIQIIVDIENLQDLTADYWKKYFLHFDEHVVLLPKFEHEDSYIGGGCPPIETEVGWLLIYHGVHNTIKGFVYSACAALLSLENPQKELARLPYPLFKPELEWEIKGEVNNVCFPTGAVVFNDTLYIYYGAADERIACASVSLPDLLNELQTNIITYG